MKKSIINGSKTKKNKKIIYWNGRGIISNLTGASSQWRESIFIELNGFRPLSLGTFKRFLKNDYTRKEQKRNLDEL